jgi:predicted nucleic acid-binding protein
MPRAAVPDTSCLIALSSLGLLDLLPKLYDEITIPAAVVEELGEPLPQWMSVRRPGNALAMSVLREHLGAGEAEVICLAAEQPGRIAVLDDMQARSAARNLGIRHTGTLGVLVRAHREGLLASLKEPLITLRSVGFRISDDLEALILGLTQARR